MISKKLLDLILHKEDRLSQRWVDEVKKSPYMKSYQGHGDDELRTRNKKFFEYLAKWIDEGASREETGAYFETIGRQRYREGFPLPEILYGVFLAKKVFHDVLVQEALLTSAMEIYQALELITMIYTFFDHGNFNITRGYLEELYAAIGKSGKLSDADLKRYFFYRVVWHAGCPFRVKVTDLQIVITLPVVKLSYFSTHITPAPVILFPVLRSGQKGWCGSPGKRYTDNKPSGA